MNDKLQTLYYHPSVEIRIITQNGEPWWVLADVCQALRLQNHNDIIKHLDDDERGVDED